MKALVYTDVGQMALQTFADPVPRVSEALVRIEAAGICGSDMHAWLGHDERRPAPLILGHEAAGIAETGRFAGRRVTINPLATCGTCPACLAGRDNLCPQRQIISMPPRQGAFAERIAIPEANLVEVPDGITAVQACLAEPLACGWHGVRLGLAAGRASNALVIGGGAIGLGVALALRAQGVDAITVVEPNPLRREALTRIGGFRVVEAADVAAPDLVVDAVGYEATRALASGFVRPGGVIVHIGLGSASGGLDVRRMTLHEVTFIGTYTYTAQDFRDTAAAMFDGRLGPLDWPETRPLSEGQTAFTAIRNGQVAAPKIVLCP